MPFFICILLDRDGAFFPTVLIVVASCCVLFAVIGGSTQGTVSESLITGVSVLAASVGLRRSSWRVSFGCAAHGALDLVHARIVDNPGVPAWWAAPCMSYDVAASAYLAWRLSCGRAARTASVLAESAR